MSSTPPLALAIHGGAGARRERSYDRQTAHLRDLIEHAAIRLREGSDALDIVVETVAALEDSGLYVAGRGAGPNSEGHYELDASVMDGATARAGAVAALQGFQSPIRVARSIMQQTPHVMLAGEGAAAFARSQGLPEITDQTAWYTGFTAARDLASNASTQHGTVGCVALDIHGRLASATSTGGVANKLAGRVGDSPIIGAGTWADQQVAVSCTGQGEVFIRAAVAAQIGLRVRLAGQSLAEAAAAALEEARLLGGDGGLIAIDRAGNVAMPYNTQGMARAAHYPDGRTTVDVF